MRGLHVVHGLAHHSRVFTSHIAHAVTRRDWPYVTVIRTCRHVLAVRGSARECPEAPVALVYLRLGLRETAYSELGMQRQRRLIDVGF